MGVVEKHRFTLVELLVAISIIAILISLLGPSIGQGRETSNQASCRTNLRSVGLEVSRLYMNTRFPTPLDPFQSGNGVVRQNFFQPVQINYAHMPPPPPPPPEEPPPVVPPPNSGGPQLSSLDFLTLMMEGCASVLPNPLYELDPSAPRFRSFSFLEYNEGLMYSKAWPWLLSESHFSKISVAHQLAGERHGGKVSVYFKDGHAEILSVEDVEFPSE